LFDHIANVGLIAGASRAAQAVNLAWEIDLHGALALA
jgi:hypothetical protein